MEGYSTQRFASAPSSPTKPPQRAGIFNSANDILRDVYASAPPRPPISPRKRAREADSDHELDSMGIEAERGEDTESDGETVIILDATATRPVKPRPRRGLTQTQSLPNAMFGLPGRPQEQRTESDWSTAASTTSSQPPAFEPMVL
jgi:hypothetical protein